MSNTEKDVETPKQPFIQKELCEDCQREFVPDMYLQTSCSTCCDNSKEKEYSTVN